MSEEILLTGVKVARAEPGATRPSVESPTDDQLPFATFDEQARATLRVLREQFASDQWLISRLIDDRLVVEYLDPPEGPIAPGSSFPWQDTVCARMVAGDGPTVAPSLAAVPAYASTRVCRELDLGAYAGVPLFDREGQLWGTLCGVRSRAVPGEPCADEAFLRWIGRSLSTQLTLSAPPTALQGRSRKPGASTLLDPRAWGTMLEKEHERSVRTGAPSCVIELDLAAEESSFESDTRPAIDEAAQLVVASARGCDFVARLAMTRLGVLAVNCSVDGARALTERLVDELAAAGIHARAGIVDVLPRADTPAAKPAESPGPITYIRCGKCNRRGAYISPRFPVLRCKYCGLRHPLGDTEWRDALQRSSVQG